MGNNTINLKIFEKQQHDYTYDLKLNEVYLEILYGYCIPGVRTKKSQDFPIKIVSGTA